MIKVKINGVEYTNIASVEPFPEYELYHSVKTMDGKLHKSVKGVRTNYDIVFFNINFEQYDELKKLLFSAKTVLLEVPTGAEKTVSAEYYPVVNGDVLKGLLWNGKYYNTALSVTFERVDLDEQVRIL